MDEKWRELLVENRDVVLLSADVDRIQDYVFESARLPEIRGASMLVEKLNEDAARNYLKGYAIYKGGGSLLAILPDMETAGEAKKQIERLFLQNTGVVTTTCVLQQTTTAELKGGYKAQGVTPEMVWALRNPNHAADWERISGAFGQLVSMKKEEFIAAARTQFETERHFGQMVELMSVLLRREKDQRLAMPFYETLPHMQRCRSCGQRPASLMGQYNDVAQEPWPFCDPCWRKITNRKERRNEVLQRAKANLSPAYFDKVPTDQPVEAPNDLTDVGQACQARQGYVALIYVDGDSIGQFISQQGTPEEYAEASQRLSQTTHQAIYEAFDRFLPPARIKRKSIEEQGEEEEVYIHPFEIIAIGGDDALLIVPADMALPIALSISQGFSKQFQDKRLTMSVGIVIAPAHTPVRSLRDIARQLLKSAKKRARKSGDSGQKEGGVDFLVLTSQSVLRRNLDDLRNSYPVRLPGEGKISDLRLTGAPYTISETLILLGLLYQMRQGDFPTSQLQQLAAALREGRERGSLYFLYQQARLKNRPYGKSLKLIEEQWGFDPTRDPVPWQAVEVDPSDSNPDAGYISILPDLADLFSFVPRDKARLEQWRTNIPEVAHANSD